MINRQGYLLNFNCICFVGTILKCFVIGGNKKFLENRIIQYWEMKCYLSQFPIKIINAIDCVE